MRLDRDSLGKVPTNSATPTTVPDPFRISAMRPLTRVSRDRNSQVFFLERIRLIQGSLMIKPFISAHPRKLSSKEMALPQVEKGPSVRRGCVIWGGEKDHVGATAEIPQSRVKCRE